MKREKEKKKEMNSFEIYSPSATSSKFLKESKTIVTTLKSNNNQQNSSLFLEMSKTANLLSRQMLELHKSLMNPSFRHTCNISDLNSTQLSSGYNSMNSSNESLTLNDYEIDTLQHNNEKVDLGLESSTSQLKRSLFDHESDTTYNRVNVSSKSKRQKIDNEVKVQRTPRKDQIAQQPPSLPSIKEYRKKVKQLPGLESYKMRLYYNEHINKFIHSD